MKWTVMRWPIRAVDVLDALGAWEDSHGTGITAEERAEAKRYAADILGLYVTQQVGLLLFAFLVFRDILFWAFP